MIIYSLGFEVHINVVHFSVMYAYKVNRCDKFQIRNYNDIVVYESV